MERQTEMKTMNFKSTNPRGITLNPQFHHSRHNFITSHRRIRIELSHNNNTLAAKQYNDETICTSANPLAVRSDNNGLGFPFLVSFADCHALH